MAHYDCIIETPHVPTEDEIAAIMDPYWDGNPEAPGLYWDYYTPAPEGREWADGVKQATLTAAEAANAWADATYFPYAFIGADGELTTLQPAYIRADFDEFKRVFHDDAERRHQERVAYLAMGEAFRFEQGYYYTLIDYHS